MSGFFPLVFGISEADVKNGSLNSLFFQNLLAILFFLICVFYLQSASSVLFLKKQLWIVFWVFDQFVLCLEVTCWYFGITTFEFFRVRRDQFLSVITGNTGISPNQNSMSSGTVRFSSMVLNLSSKERYKTNHFGWKIIKKVLKLTELMTQI